MSKLHRDGWAGIQKANHELAVRARELLCQRLQVERCCPDAMLGAMATIPMPARFQGRSRAGKIDAEQLQLYDRFRIEVPFVRMGKPQRRYFRISAELYNSIQEYEYLATALERL
jgi:isopenicillin-N epimerase